MSVTIQQPATRDHHVAAMTKDKRLGQAFARMLVACPGEISSYGACLSGKVAEGNLERSACNAQFAALSRCFAQARAGKKS